MSNLFNAADSVEAHIAQAHSAFVEFDTDLTNMRYRVLEAAYRVYFHYQEMSDQSELVMAMVNRQVHPAKVGDNSALPVIRIIAGHFDPNPKAEKVTFMGYNNLTPFKLNKSWDKQAGVLRYAFKNDIMPEDFLTWVKDFKSAKGRGGLNAIQAADTKQFGTGPRTKRAPVTKERKAELVQRVLTAPRVAVSEPTDEFNGKYSLASVYVKDGVIYINHLIKDSETAALKAADVQVAAATPAQVQTPELLQAIASQTLAMNATRNQVSNEVAA